MKDKIFWKLGKELFSFTMAEILISLTIIGIVASITLNSLRANINEKAWNVQRKTLHNRLTQAIAMLPSLNAYGEYVGSWNNNSVTVSKDNAAQAFVTEGLSKVLKINNICSVVPYNMSSENARKEFKKCGISAKFTTFGNTKEDMPTRLSELKYQFNQYNSVDTSATTEHLNYYLNPLKHVDTRAVAFETANGESVLAFYLPYCMYGKSRADATNAVKDYVSANGLQDEIYAPEYRVYATTTMCLNFIYDLNGRKGPNKIYKDMGFITVFYPTDSEVVAPVFAKKNAKNPNDSSTEVMTHNLIARACNLQDTDSRTPTLEELLSLYVNTKALKGDTTLSGYAYWSSTLLTPDYAYVIYGSGCAYPTKTSITGGGKATYGVRCVKK